jgi:hypothetical protein
MTTPSAHGHYINGILTTPGIHSLGVDSRKLHTQNVAAFECEAAACHEQ